MTTKFDSEEGALRRGLMAIGYSGPEFEEKLEELMGSEPVEGELGWPHEKELNAYETETPDGERVNLGIGEHRDGYDLWIIDPKTGAASRQ